MKTSELQGAALDWAVAKCEFPNAAPQDVAVWVQPLPCDDPEDFKFQPSTDWAQGGPIIEREGIAVDCERSSGRVSGWVACNEVAGDDNWDANVHYGPTPLIAAMRCYAASKLGEEVDIPKELMQ